MPSKKGKNTDIKKSKSRSSSLKKSTSFKDKYPKRNRERLPKYKSLHNMRVVLKSRFFNTYMRRILDLKLKEKGYKHFYFEYFPQRVVRNVAKKFNKILFNMT